MGLVIVSGGSTSYSYGGEPLREGIDRDPKNLLPGFAKKLEGVFRRMRAAGYDPMLWEGYRTPERALEMERRGVGIADSIHSYGGAADIIDTNSYWNASGGFWDALGRAAKAEGLTWGGDFGDRPHVQAITVAEQNLFRAASDAERRAMVA